MTKTEAKKRTEKLRAVISHHRYLYHVLDTQEISDAALDSLKHELYQLEQQYPEFITPDSPTQRVGGEPLKEFKKVSHKIPMLSIEDVFSEKELEDWEKYLKRLAPSSFASAKKRGYFCELKIDGFAVTLIYKNGIFVRGATRGNGRIGEDVTQNLKTIESIPLKLRELGGLSSTILNGGVEIRGEVYMEKKDFDKLNKQLEKRGEKKYANPRNLAAGSIRQLDSKIVDSRPLKFLAYDIATNLGIEKHSQKHQLLKKLGFKTDPFSRERKDLKQVLKYWREIAKKRETLPFQIDGVVVCVNNNSLFQKLGSVGKSPRGIRAFKFSPKQATTKIKDIKIQIGRTGAVTPVAILEPIDVGGAIVSRATLHNEDELKRLGVKIGDTVIIERAGDVIPAVTKVLPELRSGNEKTFQMPKFCVVCHTKLIKPAQEKVWRCPNKNCSARQKEFLEYFVSKKAFDIKGLGPKIINQLMNENLISRVSDTFELKQGDLLPIERFAKKSSENLIKAIEKSKKIDLHKFIYALGIRHVGEETAIALANHFNCLTELSNAKKEELEKISDIGEKVSQSICKWFEQKTNQKFLKDLMKAGVEIKCRNSTIAQLWNSENKNIENKKFVLTGELNTMTRDEAKEKIRFLGGNPSNSVSKNTDYLIAGENPGAKKFAKAKELGIKIISEKEFLGITK
jgi:DNA ligase (NAD+)